MAFITDQQLADFLGDPSIAGTAQAIQAASLSSAVLTDMINNPGADVVTTFTDLVIDGPSRGSNVLIIPGFPVTNVTSVSLLDYSTMTWLTPLNQGVDYDWDTNGTLYRTKVADGAMGMCFWPTYMKSIKITYTCGQTTIPGTLQAVALGMAARAYSNPQGLVSESIAGYSVGYQKNAISSPFVLDANEQAIIANYIDWGIG